MIRRHLLALMTATVLSATLLAQDHGMQRSFDGDTVRLDLSAGNYRVTASADGRIRVQPRTKANDISIRIDVNFLGSEASVRVTGPKDGADVDIQVPARVGVVVELAGGSLQVSGVDGAKKVTAPLGTHEVAAGNLRVRVDNGRIVAEN